MAVKQPLSSFTGLRCTLGSFNFVEDSPIFRTEKPYEITVGNLPPEEESMRTNVTKITRSQIPVYDLRPKIGCLNLDTHGLEFVSYPQVLDFDIKTEEGLQNYLNATNELLRKQLDAETVITFDYNIRRSGNEDGRLDPYGIHKAPDPPADDVHTDATREGGPRRIRRHLTNKEAAMYFDGTWRVRMVNVWRPCFKVVKHAPLAFCDPKSLHEDDLLAIDLPAENYVGEIYYIKYNPNQRWYWLSNQRPEEITLFMTWDSDARGASEAVPHAAFREPYTSQIMEPRESIETRAIVMSKRK